MGYTIVLLLMLALCFGVLFLDLTVSQYVEDIVKDLPVFVVILLGLRNILATVIIALFMTGALKLYLRRKVEDKRYTKFRVLLPGMIFTSISWNLLGRGVSLYTKYFTSSMYGNLGAVFIAMMWIYFMMLLLLYGVQINYVYREQFYLFSFKKVFSAIRRRLIKKKKTDTKAASQ
jgi:membrane protein